MMLEGAPDMHPMVAKNSLHAFCSTELQGRRLMAPVVPELVKNASSLCEQ